ncbi:hypothetical protein DE146DRAFT_361332 [Phaeosphaeria sp. MPI-PUGE-AT-0046c]|nr:hypothetical protein DE146DRAFT_361332 [Phaeosphaeria sp. MPI-PUGE-AT-0046c]
MSYTALRVTDGDSTTNDPGKKDAQENRSTFEDPAQIKEIKGLGWKDMRGTVAALVLPYISALFIAAAHFSLYQHLDGKRVDLDTSIPQSWLSSLALVLVTSFRVTICFALGVALTQALWQRIRAVPMSIADFDRMHYLRNDLLALAHKNTILLAPVIFTMAVLSWLVSIAIIFPPAAITITNRNFTVDTQQRVPTFDGVPPTDSTYMSAQDGVLYKNWAWHPGGTQPPVLAIAKSTLITGEIFPSNSPCGLNCTFETVFDGPLVNCNRSTYNRTIFAQWPRKEGQLRHIRPPIFTAAWANRSDPLLEDFAINENVPPGWILPRANISAPEKIFQSTCVAKEPSKFCVTPSRIDTFLIRQHKLPWNKTLKYIDPEARNLSLGLKYDTETSELACKPAMGKYTVRTTYSDGQRQLSISVVPSGTLESLWGTDKPKFKTEDYLDKIPANSTYAFQVLNLFALVDGLLSPLIGEYRTRFHVTTLKVPDYNGKKYPPKPITVQSDQRFIFEAAVNTIIADSTFNRARYKFQRADYNTQELVNKIVQDPSDLEHALDLELTEDKLNEALQNITLSVMYALDMWNATTYVRKTTNHNVFTFSSRPRLLIPYGISLLVTLPFLIIGFRSLRLNGMPAVDGGFIQPLVTTAISSRLRDIAVEGSHKPYNAPESLKTARIQYGYLEKHEMSGVRECTGFGLEGEVVSLRAQYITKIGNTSV